MEHVVRSTFTWNTAPGSLVIVPEFSQSLDKFPFYWRHLGVGSDSSSSSLFTAIVYVTSRSSFLSASPLHRLMRTLNKCPQLHKVCANLWWSTFEPPDKGCRFFAGLISKVKKIMTWLSNFGIGWGWERLWLWARSPNVWLRLWLLISAKTSQWLTINAHSDLCCAVYKRSKIWACDYGSVSIYYTRAEYS